MTLDLNLPYRLGRVDRAQFPRNANLSVFLIRQAVTTRFPQSLDRSGSMLWADIQDKLLVSAPSLGFPGTDDELVDAENLVLSGTEFRWLRDVVEKVDLPAVFSACLWTLRKALEGAAETRRPAEGPVDG